MILTIFFVSLFAVSAVSALDNATDDVVGVEETDEVVSIPDNDVNNTDSSNENNYVLAIEDQDNDYVGANEENELSASAGTFSDLASDIANADEELNLKRNYVFADEDAGNVVINRGIIINGNGFSINGNNKINAFSINAPNVILKNISFINCMASNIGGAINWQGSDGQLLDCSFNNCQVSIDGSNRWGYGGAVYWSGDNGLLNGCTFENCHVSYYSGSYGYGGAVHWSGYNGRLTDSNFKECYVSSVSSRYYDAGGAVHWGSANGLLDGCTFENCHATLWGGAVYCDVIKGIISNCSFIKCYTSSHSQNQGGAVYWTSDNGKLFNCTFIDCHVSYSGTTPSGGAVYWNGYDGELYDCKFLNCYAISSSKNYGVALFWGGVNGRLSNSSFINCHVPSTYPSSESSAIFWYNHEGIISNVYFNPFSNSIYKEDGASDLIINKLNAKIDLNNVSCNYMDDINFKLHLKDDFGSNLENRKILFENKDLNISISTMTDSVGIASLPNEFTKYAGNYTIYVSFSGDDNYNPIQNTFNLNIKPLDSSVISNNCSISVDHSIALTVNIVCSNGVSINEGAVTFFDGETNIGKTNVINGVATLNYVPTTAGKHTIKAIYSSNNYNSSNSTFILTVSKANVDLNIDALTVYFSNPSNFVINVNSNFKGVNEGKIKLFIDNVFINTLDVENGVARLNQVMNTTGSFNLSVVYDETDNYFGKNASKIFYVDKMPTTLSGETTFFDEEQSRIFTVNLKDNNGDGVNNQTVKIEVVKYSGESKTLTNVTDENGVAFFDVGSLAGGMWIVRGIFDENNNYQGSLFTDKFIVIRMNTITTIDEIKDSHKGYPIQLHANILDEFGVWITDGIAHFYVDGKNCGYIDYSSKRIFPYRSENKQILRASIPDFDNQLGATVADSSNLYLEYIPTEGTHTINVVYEGTSLYRPSNHTTTFEVQDGAVPTTLVATNINAIYNGGGYLVATLKDAWGKPIPNVKISINVKGVKYLTTDKNGQVKLSTNGLAPKSYIATITFAGNNNYVKSTATAKVTVTKATPKLTAKSKTFKKSVKTKKYTVTLKDNVDKVIKNMKLTIKVNKKTYTTKTNTKGKATFKIKKLTKKGKYVATVTFKGNAYYNKVAKKVKIVVK